MAGGVHGDGVRPVGSTGEGLQRETWGGGRESRCLMGDSAGRAVWWGKHCSIYVLELRVIFHQAAQTRISDLQFLFTPTHISNALSTHSELSSSRALGEKDTGPRESEFELQQPGRNLGHAKLPSLC
jgi:hypothetical protein